MEKLTFSRLRVLTWIKQMEDEFFIKCPVEGCRFISLSITEMMDHEASCNTKDELKFTYCKYCSHGLSDENSLSNHLIFSHSTAPEVKNGSVQYFCPSRECKLKRLSSPEICHREEYIWRVLLESKGYSVCLVPSCRFVTCIIPEMKLHYLDCSPELWSELKYVCEKCGGKTLTDSEMEDHKSECHNVELKSADRELKTFWTLTIDEFGLSKCGTANCKFVAKTVSELERHFTYCRVPRVENYDDCFHCGAWLETGVDLRDHLNQFHPSKDPGTAQVLMSMEIPCSNVSLLKRGPELLSESHETNVDDKSSIVKQEDGIGEIREELRKVLNPDATFLGEMAKIIAQEWKNEDHPIEVAVRSDEKSFAVKVPDLALASQVVNRRMPSYTLKKVSKQTLEDNLNLLEKSQRSTKIECINIKPYQKPKPLAFVQENQAALNILRSLRIRPTKKAACKRIQECTPKKRGRKREMVDDCIVGKKNIKTKDASPSPAHDDELVDDPPPAKKSCTRLPESCPLSQRPSSPKKYSNTRKTTRKPKILVPESGSNADNRRAIKLKKLSNLKHYPRKKINPSTAVQSDTSFPIEPEGQKMLHSNIKTYQRTSKKTNQFSQDVDHSRAWLCSGKSSFQDVPEALMGPSVNTYRGPLKQRYLMDFEDLTDTNSAVNFTSELIISEWKEYCDERDSTGPSPPFCTTDCTIGLDLILETTIFHGYYDQLFPWEVKQRRSRVKTGVDSKLQPAIPTEKKLPIVRSTVSSSSKQLNLPLSPIKKLVDQVARDVVFVQNHDSLLMAFPTKDDTFTIHFDGEAKVLKLDDIIYNERRTKYPNDQIVFVVEKIVPDNPEKINAAISATKKRLSKRRADGCDPNPSGTGVSANSAASIKKKGAPVLPESSSVLSGRTSPTDVAVQGEPFQSFSRTDVSCSEGNKNASRCSSTLPSAPKTSKDSDSPEVKKKQKKKSCKRLLLSADELNNYETPVASTSKTNEPKGKSLRNCKKEIAEAKKSPAGLKARKSSGKKSKLSKKAKEPLSSSSDEDSTRFLYIAGDAEKATLEKPAKKMGRPPLRKRSKNGTFLRQPSSDEEDNLFLYIGEDAKKAKQQKTTKISKEEAATSKKKLVPADQRIMYNSTGFDPYRQVKCAVCGEVMTAHAYKSKHLARHNHLCWLEDEEPLDLTDEKALERLLFNVYVQSKAAFKCEQCGGLKKSAKGFLNHRRFCGKSPLERQNLMTPCEYCSRMLMPYSYQAHIITFHSNVKKDKKEIDTGDDSSLNPRSAATKCMEKINKNAQDLNNKTEIIDEKEEENVLLNHGWIKFCFSLVKRRVNKDLKQILETQMTKEGLAHCLINGCNFSDTNVQNVVSHYRFCDKQPLENKCCECGYICLLESRMVNHVRMNHHDKAQLYSKRVENGLESANMVAQGAIIPFVKAGESRSRSNNFLEICIPWTKQWRAESIENTVVFPHLEPSVSGFEDVENFPQHMNLLSESMRVSFDSSQPQWFSIPKLSSCQLGDANEGSVLYVGGLAKTLDWFPSESQQYLAISVASVESSKKTGLSVDSAPAHIQIWSCGDLANLGDTFQPLLTFEYAICHEFGVTWDIVCCPGGQPDEKRLGLVALATSSGKVAIFAPPVPNESFRAKACHLKPVMTLELGIDESFQITKITWSKLKPHKYIAAGFTNGVIGVWDLTSTSSLLKLNDSILPFKLFNPHLTTISALSFCPVNDQFLLTGCTEKSFKIWNLNDTSLPQVEHTRGLVTDAAWLRYWMGTISCYDDSYSTSMTTACFNTLRNLVYSIQPMVTQTESGALSISVNDWLNGYIVGFDSGQVVLSFARKLSGVHNDDRRRICNSLMTMHFQRFDPTSDATPVCTSYEQAAKEFGVILSHTPKVSVSSKIKPHKYTDLTYFPSLAANKVCWNPSENSFLSFATAYNLGIVVVSQLKLAQTELRDMATRLKKL